MKHTTTHAATDTPSVFISKRIGQTRDRLKIYVAQNETDKIFLTNGDNFELEFENYTNKRFAAKIKINGRLISTSKLVLEPGQHIYLDRFIDVDRKFQFDTYNIDDTPQANSATKDNGLVEVKFYKEQEVNLFLTPVVPITPWIKPVYPYQPDRWVNPSPTWWYATNDSHDQTYKAGGMMSANYCNCTNTPVKNDVEYCCDTQMAQIETGRINAGEKSDQHLHEIYATFEIFPTYTQIYQILPASHIPMEVRKYCGDCGYRIRKGQWKYCPSCGEEL
jgi:hypothetical protein